MSPLYTMTCVFLRGMIPVAGLGILSSLASGQPIQIKKEHVYCTGTEFAYGRFLVMILDPSAPLSGYAEARFPNFGACQEIVDAFKAELDRNGGFIDFNVTKKVSIQEKVVIYRPYVCGGPNSPQYAHQSFQFDDFELNAPIVSLRASFSHPVSQMKPIPCAGTP